MRCRAVECWVAPMRYCATRCLLCTDVLPCRESLGRVFADATMGCGRWGEGNRVTDEDYMRMALAEARLAADEGEVPIGAVVVHEGEVIARAHNRREKDRDPSAHAEFSALLAAARALDRWRLTGCTVYVTLEPCLMCAGLMVNSRIDRCVFGAPDPKGGALGTLFDVSHDERLNHEFEAAGGVLQDECAAVLREFFRARRQAAKAAKKKGPGDAEAPACC